MSSVELQQAWHRSVAERLKPVAAGFFRDAEVLSVEHNVVSLQLQYGISAERALRRRNEVEAVLSDLFAFEPFQGISVFTAEYYEHIWVSCRRILFAFCIATGLGVPLGLLMGWSVPFRHFTFPILEILRPIPILAWVPLSILMFKGFEAPVIFLATLASLFVTMLNTMLGVQSIDDSYFRAAGCLGSSKWQIFRHVVVPGALPFVFTGLQISIGVAWFSLVAAEMVSGDWGLGYLIVDAYMNNVTVPMVIGMVTLGFVGWGTSIVVRFAGNRMMQWRTRALALEGR